MTALQRIFSDTPAEVEEVLIDLYRRMPSWRKFELVDDAIRTFRSLAMMGLVSRHPGESIVKLRRRLVGIVLGEDTAAIIYGRLDAGE